MKKHNKSRHKAQILKVTVDRLGTQGDGIASDSGQDYFIPFSQVGDELTIKTVARRGNGFQADIQSIDTASDKRVPPQCRHFTQCGGCQLQHISHEDLADFKRDAVQFAMRRVGIDRDLVQATRAIGPHTRRRARFNFRQTAGGGIFGFNAQKSKQIINLKECPLLTSEFESRLASFKALCMHMPEIKEGCDVQVTLTDSGYDITFHPLKAVSLGLESREMLAQQAENLNIARISWMQDGFIEPVVARANCRVMMGTSPVDVPADSFLQPSEAGQALLVSLALEFLQSKAPKAILDLYCGCGSFTFPASEMAHKPHVHGYDGMDAQIHSVRKAAHGKKISADIRDLARHPLTVEEMDRFDALIFDPPRAGAESQCEEIAKSQIKHIVAISCHPGTLARDLSILIEGGYKLHTIIPVDQFTWSSHCEAVAYLSRD